MTSHASSKKAQPPDQENLVKVSVLLLWNLAESQRYLAEMRKEKATEVEKTRVVEIALEEFEATMRENKVLHQYMIRMIHEAAKNSCVEWSTEDKPVDSGSRSRELELLVRLRQPFGALLLAQQRGSEYKKIASDHRIVAQVKNMAAVDDMVDVRTLVIL
ncbi:hypothetical protein EDB19DRAFT_1914989 [Suillus lakei]|nr:hypothetical protein EDB19DRAFT_1914989 [Suillus lakei]